MGNDIILSYYKDKDYRTHQRHLTPVRINWRKIPLNNTYRFFLTNPHSLQIMGLIHAQRRDQRACEFPRRQTHTVHGLQGPAGLLHYLLVR